MAFDFQSGVAGAGQGFEMGGPWGAVAGGVIGGVMGGIGKKKKKKAGRMQKAFMAQSLIQIKRQNEIAAQQWKFYQDNVEPMEQQIAQEIRTGKSAGAPEEMSRRYRDRASADVMHSFQKQRDITKRQNAQIGLDPSSGRSQALEQKAAIRAGASEAGAVTRAGERATRDFVQDRNQFIGRHSGKPGESFAQAGQVAGQYGNLVDYYEGKGNQALQAAGEGTQALLGGFNAAKGAFNTSPSGGGYTSPANPHQADGGIPPGEFIASGYKDGGMGAEAYRKYRDGGYNDGGGFEFAPGSTDQSGGTGSGLGYEDGGAINGPGGPIDDQVPTSLPENSYVIPSDVVSAMGSDFFDKLESQYSGGGAEGIQSRVNAMTSDGEYVMSPSTVQKKGKKFFDDLLAKYHKPAAQQSKQYQKETENSNDTDGARHQFIEANNGYQGQRNTAGAAVGGGYAGGGYLSGNVTEQPVDPNATSYSVGGQDYGYTSPDLGPGQVNWANKAWKSPQDQAAIAAAAPPESFSGQSSFEQQGDITTGASAGDRIAKWKANRARQMGTMQHAADTSLAATAGKRAPTRGIFQGPVDRGRKDGGKIDITKMGRRGRLRHGYRSDGGSTEGVGPYHGGNDVYQGTWLKDGGAYHGGAHATSGLGGYKDGEKPKTRRGGKKHRTPMKDKTWTTGPSIDPKTGEKMDDHVHKVPRGEDYQDGGSKHEVKRKDGGKGYTGDSGYTAKPHGTFTVKNGGPTPAKAKEMLKHGEVRGRLLTPEQKGYFGAVAGGNNKMADGGIPLRDLRVGDILTGFLGTSNTDKKKKPKPKKKADGKLVKGSPEWYAAKGIRPKVGDTGPAPKKVRGDYSNNKSSKTKTASVVKRRVYASEPGSKKYGEE